MAVVYWIRKNEHTDLLTEGYIGVTERQAADRFLGHKYEVSGGSTCPVHNAMRKYGPEIVLETLVEGSIDYCYALENRLRPQPKIGWNIAIGGAVSPMQGRKHTAEVIADLKIKQAGANNGFYGKTHSADFAQAQRQRRTGTTATEQTRELKSLQSKGEGNAFYGKTHSEESKNKIRDKRLNFSDEKKAELAQVKPMLGKQHSTAAKTKMRESAKLRVHGPRGWEPWEHPRANKQIWLRADEIYAEYLKDNSMSPYRVALAMGVAKQPVSTILAKLHSGWIPITDATWLQFKEGVNIQE